MRRLALVALALLVPGCSSGTPDAAPSPTPSPTAAPTLTASPAPSPTPRACRVGTLLPPGSVVSVIGDSYTSGGGAQRWPDQLARRTGWRVFVDAADGSGYTIGGFTGRDYSGPTFRDQVAKVGPQDPDLVIVMGSRNDINRTDYPYEQTVEDTLRAVRRAAPQAPMLVVGSYWPSGKVPDSLRYIHSVLRQKAAAVSCTSWLDPVEQKWFQDGTPGLVASDFEHPSDKGLVYVTDKYVENLTAMGYLPPSG